MMSAETGQVHSIETLGALDGPGLRCVVFLQGCPLQCRYCHNPDTWAAGGGTAMTADAVLARIQRCRPYFGRRGGVTLSGGEPMLQARFAAQLLARCVEQGIHTAVDTSGAVLNDAVRDALDATNLVILDIKHTDADRYQTLTGGSLARTLEFLHEVATRGLPLWVRQVSVPGWNDTPEDVRALANLVRDIPSLERVELLPYHRLGVEKWRALGREYPLADIPAMTAAHHAMLTAVLRDELPAKVLE